MDGLRSRKRFVVDGWIGVRRLGSGMVGALERCSLKDEEKGRERRKVRIFQLFIQSCVMVENGVSNPLNELKHVLNPTDTKETGWKDREGRTIDTALHTSTLHHFFRGNLDTYKTSRRNGSGSVN